MENIPGFLHLVSESYQKEGASDILPDDSANTADSANYADSTNNELGSIHRIPQPPNELLKAHSSRAAKPEAGSNDPFYLIKNSLRGHIHTTCAGFSTPRRQRRLIGNRIRTRVAHLRHLMSIGINRKDPTVRHVAQHGSFIRKRVLTRPNKSFVDYSSNFLCHSLRDPISQVISKGCHLSRDFVRIALKTWPELIHACRLNAIDQLNGVCRSRNKEAYSQPSSSAL